MVVRLEETGGQCASDDAYWALGDALIEECGVDPVWDADILECTFKGGTKLRDAAEWLEDHCCNYSPWELYEFREMSERFPADTRSMQVTYMGHMVCDSVEAPK